jgi:epoxide hydrolase-like predicted phosphatase
MAIRAVVFDIGGVLEITPDLGLTEKWEQRLHLKAGELNEQMGSFWDDGAVGKCTLEDVVRGLRERLGMDQGQIDDFLYDLWTEYLGQPNTELIDYCRGLRPRYQTALLSNSFVGAREKEQERYQFEELVDVIIYSHKVGMAKPDRRIFEMACERLGVQPAEMIFLDDNEIHFVTARELGLHAIFFQNTAQAIADIEAVLQARSI